MIDKIKAYLIEVVLKKYGPSFVKGGVAWLFVWLGSHQSVLNSHGITWMADSHTLDIDFDLLAGGVWQSLLATMAASGGVMAMLTAIQHHGTAAVTGAPQSGDLRKNANVHIPGGERSTDNIETTDNPKENETMDLSKLKALTDKVKASYEKLQELISAGAIQKDIDDQKAVIKEVADQIKQIVSA